MKPKTIPSDLEGATFIFRVFEWVFDVRIDQRPYSCGHAEHRRHEQCCSITPCVCNEPGIVILSHFDCCLSTLIFAFQFCQANESAGSSAELECILRANTRSGVVERECSQSYHGTRIDLCAEDRARSLPESSAQLLHQQCPKDRELAFPQCSGHVALDKVLVA